MSIVGGIVCKNRETKPFFFFKQKTAYEMLRRLVGSEMCIRDRAHGVNRLGVSFAN